VAIEHARLGLLGQSYSSRSLPCTWSVGSQVSRSKVGLERLRCAMPRMREGLLRVAWNRKATV